jgi:hypothetical protein
MQKDENSRERTAHVENENEYKILAVNFKEDT